ncbi:NAD(P)/FAD-dependent oxidoreductase [Williamsia sp. CHRR-6]|uniref:NAD(P)/FAD-dependent oxidoreductase n=1 Tax=Williamsia sp. CHRR-6 TaxID=2835871 RepID=UPI001BDA4D64|nr:FAD-dependent oxidoreductase [Williamsia sp. CHRR-6]MBT0565784.1 FAD-dependent oxidoreductase [Williamsia sp. CHRR-6]
MGNAVVIVGAGLGGARVAENLRLAGFSDPITLVSRERHAPYDRPPLSKAVLRGDRDIVELKPQGWYADNDVTLLLDAEVVDADADAGTVTLASGTTLDFDTLVLATGLDARYLPGTQQVRGVHVLRTQDDAVALREAAGPGVSAVVVGAGFIGCEVAASLQSLGTQVTIVEPAPTPLYAALGPVIGSRVAQLHTSRGVGVRTGVGIERIDVSDGAVTAVVLDNGTTLATDLVVVGIGSTPTTAVAEKLGLELADASLAGGIACDTQGLTSRKHIYALGDVANWARADGSRVRRVEHWNHVVEEAKVVADAIAGTDLAPSVLGVPYFWTDQFDLKIQSLGDPSADDEVHIVDSDGDKFLAYFHRDGVLTGVVGGGRAGAVMKMRATVAARPPIADLL